eukprot:6208633-Pleurochrysis_carterae.AAC.1
MQTSICNEREDVCGWRLEQWKIGLILSVITGQTPSPTEDESIRISEIDKHKSEDAITGRPKKVVCDTQASQLWSKALHLGRQSANVDAVLCSSRNGGRYLELRVKLRCVAAPLVVDLFNSRQRLEAAHAHDGLHEVCTSAGRTQGWYRGAEYSRKYCLCNGLVRGNNAHQKFSKSRLDELCADV